MGTLRTLFAIAVVLAHCWPTDGVFLPGQNAVQLFYIISGFLISLILIEKRRYPHVGFFYLNRFLRLYPIYFLIAGVTLVLYCVLGNDAFFSVYEHSPKPARALLVTVNASLFGQDWVMFSGVTNKQLIFTKDFRTSDILLYNGLLVHQAWTLGLEMSFYLIAPLILPRRRWIWSLVIVSLLIRLILIGTGVGIADPWTYRFFPSELALFLAGALSHQLLLPYYKTKAWAHHYGGASATCLLVLLSVLFPFVRIIEPIREVLFYLLFLLLLPLTFIFQNEFAADKYIGDLSYPIYVVHTLVIWLTYRFAEHLSIKGVFEIPIMCVVGSLLGAALLNRYIAIPFELLRSRLRGL